MLNQANHNKLILQQLFASTYANKEPDWQQIEQLVSPDYQQTVNGQTLNFAQFCAHLKAQRMAVDSVTIKFLSLLGDADQVSSHHLAIVSKPDGSLAEFEVFAVFTLVNGQIIRCQELTRMIAGMSSDNDLGSRH